MNRPTLALYTFAVFRQYILWIVLCAAGVALLWLGGWVHYGLALSGDPKRQFEYGLWLDKHERKGEALMWMNMAADHYEPRALAWMGMAHMSMDYFAIPSGKEAFEYMNEAAERKVIPAMLVVAGMYEGSSYIQKNVNEEDAHKAALTWYRLAADAGAEEAIERLIQVYEKGELGMEISIEEAEYWRKVPRKSDDYWNVMN